MSTAERAPFSGGRTWPTVAPAFSRPAGIVKARRRLPSVLRMSACRSAQVSRSGPPRSKVRLAASSADTAAVKNAATSSTQIGCIRCRLRIGVTGE